MSEYRGQNIVEQVDTDATQVNITEKNAGMPGPGLNFRGMLSFQGSIACCTNEESGEDRFYLLDELMPLKYEGGQSMIYFCRRCENEEGANPFGEVLIAKVFLVDSIAGNIDEQEQKKKCQFLSSDAARDNHVLFLVDSGFVQAFYCEIYPYCKDGDVRDKKFTMQQLLSTIIPQMNEALHTVHNANLIHRDIKPGNIYQNGEEYYLADFGIASKSDKTLTSAARGTRNYMAPELIQGVVSPSVDYYALGVTLLDLYKGSHVFEGMDHAKVFQAVSKLEIPLQFPEEDLPLYHLCCHLLLPMERRMDYEGIKEFLDNPKKLKKPNPAGDSFQYEFRGRRYTELNTLCRALAQSPAEAIERLFIGHIEQLFNRYNMDDLAAQTAFIVRDTDRKINQLNQEDDAGRALLEEVALMNLLGKVSPDMWLAWRGEIYDNLSDLAEGVASGDEKKVQDIMQLLSGEMLPLWLERCPDEPVNRCGSARKMVEGIGKLAEKQPELARELLIFVFAKDPAKRYFVYQGVQCASMDDLFRYLSREKINFFRHTNALLADLHFHAFYLAQIGKAELTGEMSRVLQLAKENAQPEALPEHESVRALLGMMEDAMRDKIKLRDFYLRYGDRADILWLRYHLSDYIFLGEEAEKLHKAITAIRIPAVSIRLLMDELDQYMAYRDSFYELFEDNYFLAAMNISTSDQPTGIISQDGRSFFVYSFWGRPAPAGLAMELEDTGAF